MSSLIKCICKDDSQVDVNSCHECDDNCKSKGGQKSCDDSQVKKVLGITIGVFVAMIVISLIIMVLMIVWSVYTIKKCNGKPEWLTPTIIVLLILWLVAFPISPVIFVALLVILIIYSTGCKKRGR